jgi:hypothetical protein
MKENEIEANVFVYHREWGVGQIMMIEADGQWLFVHFRDQSERRISRGIALQSLNRLPNDGLEAILWNNPETAHNWVKNGPLRLVAAALADGGGAGKPKDLQARLQQRVLRDIQWGAWWKKTQPALKESSYFQSKGGEYILTTRVSDVPIEPLPTRLKRVTVGGKKSSKTRKPASPKEWIRWLFTRVGLAPPTNTPPQFLLDILEALPNEMLDGVSQQLLSGFRLVLQRKPMPTSRALGAWVSTIEELSNRWMESSLPASLPMLSESLVKLAVDLLRRTKNETLARHFLQILVTNLQRNDLALQGVANGLKVLFQTEPGAVMELMHDFSEQLPDAVRKPLVRRVASGLFREGTPEQQHLLRVVCKTKS